jgi:hypothetical protein
MCWKRGRIRIRKKYYRFLSRKPKIYASELIRIREGPNNLLLSRSGILAIRICLFRYNQPPWKRRKGVETEESILKKKDKTPKQENPSHNNPVTKVRIHS